MRAAAGTGSVGEALGAAVDALAAAGVEGPRSDAELLLAEATGIERGRLTSSPETPVMAPAARAFGAMVRRRVAREPVAYILGRKGFRHIELEVDARVLIPRPETELLVELALELDPATVLDVGTGSGAVALAVADELPRCEVVGTDVSRGAIAVAAANAARLGLSDRARLQVGSLPEAGEFDLVLANLPYVPGSEWQGLQPEITRYEPRGALIGGEDGLAVIGSLIDSLQGGEGDDRPGRVSTPAVGLEVGADQAAAVAELLDRVGFSAEIRADLAGIGRCVVGRRRG